MAKGTGIYNVVKGEKVELTAKQVKMQVMQIHGWTSEQYQREYDKLRNKLRAYEALQEKVGGEKAKKESPAAFLYKEARAQQRYGKDYAPSARTAAVRATQSISSGKALQTQIKKRGAIVQKFEEQARKDLRNFDALINQNPKAAEIAAKIKDPAKQLAALKAFANTLHAKITESGKVEAAAAIPFGVALGSTADIEFDYSAWL